MKETLHNSYKRIDNHYIYTSNSLVDKQQIVDMVFLPTTGQTCVVVVVVVVVVVSPGLESKIISN